MSPPKKHQNSSNHFQHASSSSSTLVVVPRLLQKVEALGLHHFALFYDVRNVVKSVTQYILFRAHAQFAGVELTCTKKPFSWFSLTSPKQTQLNFCVDFGLFLLYLVMQKWFYCIFCSNFFLWPTRYTNICNISLAISARVH